ncbi:MAG: 4-hydroxythreonine-4-phosphate dehydrogenase PdxA [Gemmatimonadetes bacterium]|nr:4-hydroxythreonine-4-phosphate dehydrogenase PdxA [Gemmatimonadota bacterium]
MRKPRIAVTLGDPRGIGPEVASRAVASLLAEHADAEVLLVGPPETQGGPARPDVATDPWDGTERSAGHVSVQSIQLAVELIGGGHADGLVTAPVHKPALHAAGHVYPGQTELLKALSGSHEVGMFMVAERTRIGGALRILLATTHIPLRDVAGAVTQELLTAQTRLLHESLREGWRIAQPCIALCGLNPHASDRGLFGDEEERVFSPVVERLRSEGMDARGPFPADTVFDRALGGEFDAVVAPYHDVGMAAFKTASFGTGVNVTLGLPFVRTSPDHGTAFDLAGAGKADPSSMLEALRLAVRLAATRLRTDPESG